jgi:hypothetical protein
MRNLVIRKRIADFTNWQFDDFMQRAVKASGSLKNNAFGKYVSDFDQSVKKFHELRKTLPTTEYTREIHNTASETDEIFRKIKILTDYTALCTTGQEQSAAQKIQSVLSNFGNIPSESLSKKFVNYEALTGELKKDNKPVATLKLDALINSLTLLTQTYRNTLVNRDKYRSELKGKRRKARVQALFSYLTLRDKVEAFAVINGDTEVSEFVKLVNEALIYAKPNVSRKKNQE